MWWGLDWGAPSSLLPSYGLVLDQGQRRKVLSLLTAWCGGFDCIPSVPQSLFSGFATVAPSITIWPQPWHLKHYRVLESFAFWALPCAHVSAWVLPLLWEAVATLLAAEELQAEVFWPRPVWPLWELGQTGVFLSVHLSHDPVPGTVWSGCRASALFHSV